MRVGQNRLVSPPPLTSPPPLPPHSPRPLLQQRVQPLSSCVPIQRRLRGRQGRPQLRHPACRGQRRAAACFRVDGCEPHLLRRRLQRRPLLTSCIQGCPLGRHVSPQAGFIRGLQGSPRVGRPCTRGGQGGQQGGVLIFDAGKFSVQGFGVGESVVRGGAAGWKGGGVAGGGAAGSGRGWLGGGRSQQVGQLGGGLKVWKREV